MPVAIAPKTKAEPKIKFLLLLSKETILLLLLVIEKFIACFGQTDIHFKHLIQSSLSIFLSFRFMLPEGQFLKQAPQVIQLSSILSLIIPYFADKPKIVPTGQIAVQKNLLLNKTKHIKAIKGIKDIVNVNIVNS